MLEIPDSLHAGGAGDFAGLTAYFDDAGIERRGVAGLFSASIHSNGPSALGMINMFTGGAMENCAVGALGIMPYISARRL